MHVDKVFTLLVSRLKKKQKYGIQEKAIPMYELKTSLNSFVDFGVKSYLQLFLHLIS